MLPGHERHAHESPLFMRLQFKSRTIDPQFFTRDSLVLKGKEKAAWRWDQHVNARENDTSYNYGRAGVKYIVRTGKDVGRPCTRG